MNKSILGNNALSSYDDIFKSITNKAGREIIVDIPLEELHSPEFHPFQVNDDHEMDRLVKSIARYGVREPGLARSRIIGGYELLCCNRRKRASEIAKCPTMPIIIRELDDNTAALVMVDSNLEQREKLLYSERAWAYRIKLEALNHRGIKSDTPGQLSVDILCEQTGESKNQIFRLVRLTELIVALIDKVDTKQLAFNPAVELSYLPQTEQAAVAAVMELYEIKPSLSQARRLKQMKLSEQLTVKKIDAILSEVKKSSKSEIAGSMRFHEYFPPNYSQTQMDEVITSLLKSWQAGQTQINKGGVSA